MGYLFSIIMIVCCMFNFDGYYLIAAGLFAIAGAIESKR